MTDSGEEEMGALFLFCRFLWDARCKENETRMHHEGDAIRGDDGLSFPPAAPPTFPRAP